jgi:fibronectin type 3 domain-containing protein
VTAFFTAAGVGNYLVQLKVTDTTATSFPSSGMGDLSDTNSAQVSVRDANDPACAACIDDLAARPKLSKIQLTWTDTGAHHYNVYRGTIAGGPYLKIGATTSTYSTYLDTAVVTGQTYYYVVRPAAVNDAELCQSNEASATLANPRRR